MRECERAGVGPAYVLGAAGATTEPRPMVGSLGWQLERKV